MKTESVTKTILLRADRIVNYKNGTVAIEVPATELSEEDHKTLRRLFPNLTERVYTVLDQESLLTCLHDGPIPPCPEGYSPDYIECHPYGSPLNPKVKPK